MVAVKRGDDWRSWITRVIVRERALLAEEEKRLEGIRAGRRLKPHIDLGWTDASAAQEAYVRTLRQWIGKLEEPDMWLLAFLGRGDFGSSSWEWGFEDRRTQFIRKHAGEPSWERARPRYARRRAKTAARSRDERQRKTGDIDRQAIYARDRGICGICGKPVPADDFHLDHIDPAGPHGPENLRVAHPLCNVHRGDGYPHPGEFEYPERAT